MPSVFKLFPQQCCPVIALEIIWRKTAPTHQMILFVLLPSAPVVMSVINLSCSSSLRTCRPNPKYSAFCGAVLLAFELQCLECGGAMLLISSEQPCSSNPVWIILFPCGNPVEPCPHKWKIIQPFWSSTGILLCARRGQGALPTTSLL